MKPPCPDCGTTVQQARADGRCVGCGKLLPEELRGSPKSLVKTAVAMESLTPGDITQMEDAIQFGDIVVLIKAGATQYVMKAISQAEMAEYSGPKYRANRGPEPGTVSWEPIDSNVAKPSIFERLRQWLGA